MKGELNGHHFDSDEEIIAAVDNFLVVQDTDLHKEWICSLYDC